MSLYREKMFGSNHRFLLWLIAGVILSCCGIQNESSTYDNAVGEAAHDIAGQLSKEPLFNKSLPNATNPVSSPKKDADEKIRPNYPASYVPTPLDVPGFNAASHVVPTELHNDAKPVVIVLHGNFDRPEWQCEMWGKIASSYGWILCPRGTRTPYATKAEDRWTYRGGAMRLSGEMLASLVALEETYPDLVTREGLVLVGFSLGAILAPEIIQLNKGMFPVVFFVEGGLSRLERYLGGMKKNGVKAIGLAMSTPKNRQKAQRIQKRIKKKGFQFVYVDMRGAGHNYRDDFDVLGTNAFSELLMSTKL